MKAIVFDRVGPPEEVLEIRDVPMPKAADGEVLVKMESASINPGDFLFIQSLYPEPKKPVFPQQIAGNHGAGIDVKSGALVAFSYYNTWAEYAAVPAEWLIPLPTGYPLEKAGQLLNPITAWDLLADSQVRPGQWLAVTAGNSTVATMVLQFAKLRGVNVISIVRKAPRDVLRSATVIELSTLDSPLSERIMEITAGQGLHGVIDCVGGPMLNDLVRCMALGGQVVIYGGMRADNFALHNFDVLLKVVTIKPHIYRYFFGPPRSGDAAVLEQIVGIFGHADFQIPIAGLHALEDFAAAIKQTLSQPELGKRLFLPGGAESLA